MRTFNSTINGPTTEATIFSGSVIATTSGTSHDFTGIPSGTKKITVGVADLSTNNTSIVIIQLGDSGGIETTGYTGVVEGATGTPVSLGVVGSGFQIYDQNGATFIYSGIATLMLIDASTNTWSMSGLFARTDSHGILGRVAGTKSLTGTLDMVRLTTVNGSDTFDAGKFNIVYDKY